MSRQLNEDQQKELEVEVIRFLNFTGEFFKIARLTDYENERYFIYDIKKDKYDIHNNKAFASILQMRLVRANLKFRYLEKKFFLDTLIKNNQIIELNDLGYEPSLKKIIQDEYKKYFNTYKASKYELSIIENIKNYENKIEISEAIKKYKFPYINKLFEHLIGVSIESLNSLEFDDEKEELKNEWKEKLKYVYSYFAYIWQNPTMKLKPSLVFVGAQSSGKGRLKEWVIDTLFLKDNVKYITQSVLEGKFTNFVENKRIVIANEISFSLKSEMYERIKMLSSDQVIDVEGKNKDTYGTKNYTHWIFFSNNENPLRIESNDTRHTVFYQEKSLDKSISHKLSPELNPGYLETELNEFAQFLAQLKVDFSYVEQPLETQEKKAIKEYHKDDITRFIDFCQECGSLEVFLNEIKIDSNEKQYTYSLDILENDITNKLCFNLFQHFCKNKNIRSSRQEEGFNKVLTTKFKIKTRVTTIRDENLKKNIAVRVRNKEDLFFNIGDYIVKYIEENKQLPINECNKIIDEKPFLNKESCNNKIKNLIKLQTISIENFNYILGKSYIPFELDKKEFTVNVEAKK